MAIVRSTTFPGTRFRLKVRQAQATEAAISFDVLAESYESGVASTLPKRCHGIEQLREFLSKATDLDKETIEELLQNVAEKGFGEVPEVWLLDEQAVRFRIRVER